MEWLPSAWHGRMGLWLGLPGPLSHRIPQRDDRSQVRRKKALLSRSCRCSVGDRQPYDRDGRQMAVDALLHYPDGREGALEVSSIGPEDEAAITNYLGSRDDGKSITGLTRRWLVDIPRTFHPADLRKMGGLLRRCESHGAGDLRGLAGLDREVDHLLRRGLRAYAAGPIDPGHARAYFMASPIGGFSGNGLESLPDELAVSLSTPKIQTKIRKLQASGCSDRHLLLIVRASAFSWPVFEGLAFDASLPGQVPVLPGGLQPSMAAHRCEGGRRCPGHIQCRLAEGSSSVAGMPTGSSQRKLAAAVSARPNLMTRLEGYDWQSTDLPRCRSAAKPRGNLMGVVGVISA